MRDIETELLEQIEAHMRQTGLTQSDFATHKGVSRQSVNPYFAGRKGLLTDTGKDLLDFLGVTIKLEKRKDG